MDNPAPKPYDLSPSRISTVLDCMLKYKFRYEDEVPSPSTRPMRVGKHAHSMAARMGTLLAGNPPPLDAPRGEDFDWAELAEREKGGHEGEIAEAAEILRQAAPDLRFTASQFFERWWFLDVEADVVGGIWDRVDITASGRLHVVDYKSGRSIPPRHELATSPQTLLYLAAAKDEWPFHEVSVVYLWLRDGKWRRFDWTEEGNWAALQLVAQARARIDEADRTGDYPARVGEHCRRCPFVDVCPAVTGMQRRSA